MFIIDFFSRFELELIFKMNIGVIYTRLAPTAISILYVRAMQYFAWHYHRLWFFSAAFFASARAVGKAFIYFGSSWLNFSNHPSSCDYQILSGLLTPNMGIKNFTFLRDDTLLSSLLTRMGSTAHWLMHKLAFPGKKHVQHCFCLESWLYVRIIRCCFASFLAKTDGKSSWILGLDSSAD